MFRRYYIGAPKFRPLPYINTKVCLFSKYIYNMLLGRLTHNANCDALLLIDVPIYLSVTPFYRYLWRASVPLISDKHIFAMFTEFAKALLKRLRIINRLHAVPTSLSRFFFLSIPISVYWTFPFEISKKQKEFSADISNDPDSAESPPKTFANAENSSSKSYGSLAWPLRGWGVL